MKSITGAFGSIRRLNHIRRYSSYPVIREENVAEHSFWVTFTALNIALELEKDGVKLNHEVLMKKAMMHDIGESQTGDIVRTFKYSDKDFAQKMKTVERSMTDKFLVKNFGVASGEIYECYTGSKFGDEGIVVAFCDLLAVLTYSVEEISMGNNYMRAIMEDAYKSFDIFKGTFMEKYATVAIKTAKRKIGEQHENRN